MNSSARFSIATPIRQSTAAVHPGKINTWVALLSKHLAGQTLIHLTNILIGLVLLRIFPIREFALYTLSVVFLQIATVGSDMGLSQGINSLGARVREEPWFIGVLYSSACWYGYKLYAGSAVFVAALFLWNVINNKWSAMGGLACLFLLLLIVMIQVSLNFRKSVLNINHDANGLFYIGMAESGTRLLLIPLCMVWPHAAVALFTSLVGAYAGRIIAEHHCKNKMEEEHLAGEEEKRRLRQFITPLIPVTVYHLIQGQLSVLLLGIYGYTTSIAQIGALGRLGQFITIPMMLNGFLVQPTFSRIIQKNQFVKKAAIVLAAIFVFSVASMASVMLVPEWWLYILGSQYDDLFHELPLAVMTALVTLLGGTLYTMVISRNTTQGQSWYIFTGLIGQLMFLWSFGVHSIFDALLLTFIPVLGYALVQAVLLWRVITRWKEY